MVPVLGKPFLFYQLELLKKHGFTRFLMCVGYKCDQIKGFFGDGSRFGASINYSEEPEPLGTGGSLKYAEKFLDDVFLLLPADTLLDINFNALIDQHRLFNPTATMTLIKKQDPSQYGVAVLNGNQRIIKFVEKPKNFIGNNTNAGAIILNKKILNYIQPNKLVSIEKDVYPILVEEGKMQSFVIDETYHLDIGVPERYKQFHEDILTGKVICDADGCKGS